MLDLEIFIHTIAPNYMSRLKPEPRLSEHLHGSRRTDRPLFFDEGTEWDLSNHIEIPLDNHLPSIAPIQGGTHAMLRKIFKKRISQNEEGLSLAYVNKHDAPHMDRVANGTYHLGMYLGFPDTEVKAAALASRFHDVGYEFPDNADKATLESLGKDLHTEHASRGAKLVTETLRTMYNADPAIRKELSDWADDTFDIAHESIRLHSNDVGTDEDAHPVTLLPRFIDKIDNTHARVRPSHVDAFRKSAFLNLQHIQHKVQSGCRHLLSKDAVPSHKRHRREWPEVREHLAAVDPYYFHRIAPLAIADQRLYFNPGDISAILDYRVYPSQVSDTLQVEYTNEEHVGDFFKAYDKSMTNASNVLRLIRSRLMQSDESSHETLLTVRLMYEDGRQTVLNYQPDLFT